MKANKPERRPPFELPTHKSHRGKRDAERLIAGRNESESLLDVSLDECALFFAAQAVVKKTFAHPLDRLAPMSRENEHAIGCQVLSKEAQEVRPLRSIQVREQRSAPNQVEALAQANALDILLRINRPGVELPSAEVHRVTVKIAGGQMGMRETRPQHPADPSVAARQVEYRRRCDVRASKCGIDAIQRRPSYVEIPLLARDPHMVVGGDHRAVF